MIDLFSLSLGASMSGGGNAPIPTEFEIVNLDGEVGADNFVYGTLSTRLGFEVGDKYHCELYNKNDELIEEYDFMVEAGTGIYSGYNIINYYDVFILVDGGVFNYASTPISVSTSNKSGWKWQVGTEDKFYVKFIKVNRISPLDYVVKFTVDGEDYCSQTCTDGVSINAPSNPETSKMFGGWKDNDNHLVSFPYTPSSDVELTAILNDYSFLASNNESFLILNGNTYWCINLSEGGGFAGDKDLVGYVYDNTGFTNPVIVTKVSRKNAIRRNTYYADANNVLTYNGETYYYGGGLGYNSKLTDTSEQNRYKCQDGKTIEEAAIELLNAYFGATS